VITIDGVEFCRHFLIEDAFEAHLKELHYNHANSS
jgi:hypothetical protein